MLVHSMMDKFTSALTSLVLLLVMAPSHSQGQQANTIHMLDSLVRYKLSDSTLEIGLFTRFEHDTNGKHKNIKIENSWFSTSEVDYREIKRYPGGQIKQVFARVKDSAQMSWKDSFYYERIYLDPDSLSFTETEFRWDKSSMIFKKGTIRDFLFDQNGLLNVHIRRFSDGRKAAVDSFSYNNEGKLLRYVSYDTIFTQQRWEFSHSYQLNRNSGGLQSYLRIHELDTFTADVLTDAHGNVLSTIEYAITDGDSIPNRRTVSEFDTTQLIENSTYDIIYFVVHAFDRYMKNGLGNVHTPISFYYGTWDGQEWITNWQDTLYYSDIVLQSPISAQIKIENQFDVELYPNPANNKLNVKSFDTVLGYELFSSKGVIVSSSEVFEQSFQIDLSKYPTGLYYLSLKTSEGVRSYKFIIH